MSVVLVRSNVGSVGLSFAILLCNSDVVELVHSRFLQMTTHTHQYGEVQSI